MDGKLTENNALENAESIDDMSGYVGPSGPVVIILVGVIGSGKTTFSKALEHHFPQIKRFNQDELRDRKRVERLTIKSLSEGYSVIIDRTNIDQKQRAIWLNIARQFQGVKVWVITMNTPVEVCESRLRARTNHPTIKTWAVAKTVLNRFLAEYQEPSVLEDFDRMWELSPHPTGLWSHSDLAKTLHEIENSPSTRLEGM
ncbi:P-loop containing nucleoside triphosphate hydrolase protein [Serendipita vermifera]|nr:P-loop containing nucleoside triphosphate hydrolase protein [Serendipita vermifera]